MILNGKTVCKLGDELFHKFEIMQSHMNLCGKLVTEIFHVPEINELVRICAKNS